MASGDRVRPRVRLLRREQNILVGALAVSANGTGVAQPIADRQRPVMAGADGQPCRSGSQEGQKGNTHAL